MMVHARAQVLMGVLARFSLSFVTLRKSFSSTNGPFFELRLMIHQLLLLHIHRLRPLLVGTKLAAAEDQFLTELARAAGLAALCGDAGPRDRMTSTVAAAFATAQRMIDRVHRLGASVGTNPHVPRP